jgi:ATP-dependent protease ClpP protease subunit
MPQRDDLAHEGPLEIPLVGELSQREGDIFDKLLEVPPGGECILYFNSPGGSAYAALAIMSLIQLRGLKATGIVIGECSSAAIWPFAACRQRLVTPHSILLFHAMRWESGEHIELAEATEWARQFGRLESEMDEILAGLLGVANSKLQEWLRPGRYVTGKEVAEAGLAELIPLAPQPLFTPPAAPARRRTKK